MRILDRYMLKSIALTFLVAMMTFTLLFLLIDSASNLDEYIGRDVPITILAKYYLSYAPGVLVQTAPMALLISVLLIYAQLNAHNEIIVLRSSGMNFWRISRPALCFAVLIAVLSFLINEKFIPQAEEQAKQIKNENLILEVDRKKKKHSKIANLTFYGLKNRLYFIDSFDPNIDELQGITIIEYNENQKIREKVVALKGVWTGIAWKFLQAHVTDFAASKSGSLKIKVYEEKLMDIKETPDDFLRQRLNVTAMNIRQLQEYISRFANSGAKRAINNLRVDLHQKFAFPMVNIIIVLTGLPFALAVGRRRAHSFTSIGIAIAIGFLYYVTNAVGLALGKGGLLPPVIAAWLAPMIFLAMANYLIHTKFN